MLCTWQETSSQKPHFYCNQTPFKVKQKYVNRILMWSGKTINRPQTAVFGIWKLPQIKDKIFGFVGTDHLRTKIIIND